EYELGEADALLGLGATSIAARDLEQGLAQTQRALELYGVEQNARGQAEANATLGDLHLQRAQLVQAITVLERAQRTFRSLRERVGTARTTARLGEAQLRRSSLRKAEEQFKDARTMAQEMANPLAEASAELGLGEIARIRGNTAQADELYRAAASRFAHAGSFAGQGGALLGQARLALVAAHYDEARALLGEAEGKLQVGRVTAAPAWIALVRGEIAMDLNQPAVAAQQLATAERSGTEAGDLTATADALLAQAELALRSDHLDDAVALFNRAQDQFRAGEDRVGEGLATVGRGRVLIERELWEEGITAIEEMIPRFRETEQRGAQALATLAIAQGRRGRLEFDLAARGFAEAHDLARDTGYRWLQAQAQHGTARIALDNDDFAQALPAFDVALRLVGDIAGHIADRDERGGYLESEVPLFAEATYIAIRNGQPERAAEIVRGFTTEANRAGKAALAEALKQFEDALNTLAKESDDKAVATAYKEQAKRVSEARKLAR
ncbi:MAG: hypothetical protein H0X24_13725, partial [Ktedonobacterales bacterium]|nr:hypothetical protein [Ktedonobacterales bacterium]